MSEYFFVLERGLEPPQDCSRQGLNLVRLPIPPPQQGVFWDKTIIAKNHFCVQERKGLPFGSPLK